MKKSCVFVLFILILLCSAIVDAVPECKRLQSCQSEKIIGRAATYNEKIQWMILEGDYDNPSTCNTWGGGFSLSDMYVFSEEVASSTPLIGCKIGAQQHYTICSLNYIDSCNAEFGVACKILGYTINEDVISDGRESGSLRPANVGADLLESCKLPGAEVYLYDREEMILNYDNTLGRGGAVLCAYLHRDMNAINARIWNNKGHVFESEASCNNYLTELLNPDIFCSKTIVAPGTITLNSDLNCDSTTPIGLEILAGGVTLNCQGHKIMGINEGIGIQVAPGTGGIVWIKNCEISNFSTGIRIHGPRPKTANVIVDNNIIKNSQNGVHVTGVQDVYNSIQWGIININSNKIYCNENGVYLGGRSTRYKSYSEYRKDLVGQNMIFNNVNGIYLHSSHGGSHKNNVIINNEFGFAGLCGWGDLNCRTHTSPVRENYLDNLYQFGGGLRLDPYENYWPTAEEAITYDRKWTESNPQPEVIPQDLTDKIAIINSLGKDEKCSLGFVRGSEILAEEGEILDANWNFNLFQTNDTFVYDSIEENHGTAHNIVQITDTAGEVNSFARSYEFNGADSYVEIPDSPEISGGGKDLTVSVWFKLKSMPYNGAHIVSKVRDTNNKDYYLTVVDSRLGFGYEYQGNNWDSVGAGLPGTTVLYPDRWYHGVFTYNLASKYVDLYLNGELETRWTLPSDLPDTDAPLLFGKSGYYGTHSNVVIDEVKIYSRTLSGSEITDLFLNKPSSEVELKGCERITTSADCLNPLNDCTWTPPRKTYEEDGRCCGPQEQWNPGLFGGCEPALDICYVLFNKDDIRSTAQSEFFDEKTANLKFSPRPEYCAKVSAREDYGFWEPVELY